jgi:hypothetical protein
LLLGLIAEFTSTPGYFASYRFALLDGVIKPI